MSADLKDTDLVLGLDEKKKQGEDGTDLARVFSASLHGEDWKHAIRSNPKALLWCQYPSVQLKETLLMDRTGSYSLFSCIMWGYDGLASSVGFPPLFICILC